MNSKHICLLGFSKQIEQKLKDHIEKHATAYEIIWVPANAAQLDGVVVNAPFLDTPQIKKYLAAVKCPRVSAYSNSLGQDTAKSHGIVAIDLNEPSAGLSSQWLAVLLGEGNVKQESKPTPTTATKSEPRTVQRINDFHKVIDHINDKSPIHIVARYGEKITYLNPEKSDAYINFARDSVPGIEHWQWEVSQDALSTDAMRRINIDQWLFETIWQSKSTIFNVDPSMLYKLVRWPQPFSQVGRTEALRLAAQIKFQPVTIADLVSKTNYSNDLVEQFLFATGKAGQVEAIKPGKMSTSQVNNTAVIRNDPDREAKRSFIGRLRKKLGL